VRTRFGFIAVVGIGLGLLYVGCSNRSPDLRSVSGTIETDEARVASRYGGRVQKLYADEGDALRTGQVIVELDAAELQARRDQMAAQLSEWEAGPRKEEIAAAKHDWEALGVERDQARTDAKRAEELFPTHSISRTDLEQAQSRLQTLDRSAAAAQQRYELLLAGTRPERLAMARAQLEEMDADLREMKIVAPADCILEVLSVKLGDVLAPNREVATVLLTNHIWVRVYVPEPWLGYIQLHDSVNVRVDSDPSRTFEGHVEQIARQAEFTPRNVQTVDERVKQVFGIKIRLDNREGRFRAGMVADVTFPKVPR